MSYDENGREAARAIVKKIQDNGMEISPEELLDYVMEEERHPNCSLYRMFWIVMQLTDSGMLTTSPGKIRLSHRPWFGILLRISWITFGFCLWDKKKQKF